MNGCVISVCICERKRERVNEIVRASECVCFKCEKE